MEAKACKWAMEQALEHGVSSVIMEGDCQSLTSKPKKQDCPNIELGLLIQNILHTDSEFEFCSVNHINRTGNRVAHTIAHAQPFNSAIRVWLDEVQDFISGLVAHDTCNEVIR